MTRYTDFVNYNLKMLTDHIRIQAYRQAIFQTVRPGDVVVDLGCGSGVLAFFACQAEAQRVYAIESEEVIEMARLVCTRNGFQDRIVFLNDASFRVELPELADVLLTETMGSFGLDEGLLGSLIDGRDRFLKKGGRLIPQSLELFLVPVELPGFYDHMVDFWTNGRFGIDFSPIRRFAANNFHPLKLHKEAFLSPPVSLVRLQLAEAKSSNVQKAVSFYATRRGRVYGLAGWFSVELAPGLSLSNGPENLASHWGLAFFPLAEPVRVDRGNRIRATIHSQSNGELWRWRVEVNGQQFDQTTLWGFLHEADRGHKLAQDHAPSLSRVGETVAFLLSRLNGATTVSELERSLLQRYPDVATSQEQAAALVRDLLKKYA